MKLIYRFLRYIYQLVREDPIEGHLKRGLKVGKNVSFMEEVKIDHSHCWHIFIGDDVTLAPRVHILAHDASTKRMLGYTRIGKVTIGSRVFIGAGSIVMPGVTIGDDVVIGAGSVISRSIPSSSVAAGNPAKVLCGIEEFRARRDSELGSLPVFEEEYTLNGGVTESMKAEMNEQLGGGCGYVR